MEIFLIRALQFILAISLLVLLHEGGHFFFSKLFGVRVEKFFIFFDPSIGKWNGSLFRFKPRKSDTTYGIGWLPLGGYCKISGMVDESLDMEQMKKPAQPWEFRSKPAWQRLLIMVGGVLMNFIVAFFIYAMILFYWGDSYIATKDMTLGMKFNADAKALGFQDHDILLGTDLGAFKDYSADMFRDLAEAKRVDVLRNGKQVSIALPGNLNLLDMLKAEPRFVEPFYPLEVDSVLEKTPAATIGLKKGDVILSINGKAVDSFNEFSNELGRLEDIMSTSSTRADSLKTRAVTLTVTRAATGKTDTLKTTLTPELKLGFSPTNYADYGYKFSSDLLNTVNGVYTTGAYARNVPNEDVTWETSEQLNIGVDARFLASRLSLTFDWYKKTTKDWLVQAPMNDILGYEEPAMVNGGDVVNKGIELGIGWNDNIGKDFSYHVNANVAYNKNEVTRLATASGQIGTDQTSALFQNSSYVSLVEVGHPIGYFSGMSYSGIWQNQAQIDAARAEGKAVLPNAQPGDMIWDDYNGDGSITLDGDRHEIGDPNPDVTLGLSLGFSWKGLDFNVTGAGAFGHQIMQCYRTSLLANQYTNYTTDILDRWHGEGTSNTQPRLVVGTENNQWVSTRYMQDGNYFRIQNITLGYDFCKLWKNSPFQMLRLYVQGQNLFTFTGYTGLDPEVGSNGGGNYSWARGIDVGLYPSARTYIVGVSVKF